MTLLKVKRIVISWGVDDVLSVDDTLTPQQVSDVLKFLKDNHDAAIGINWETVANAINYIITQERELKQ